MKRKKLDETLENNLRRLVFNLVVEYPGVSFNKLRNIFELSDSNLRYHLGYLERNDKVSSVIENGIKCYYPHPSSVTISKRTQGVLESHKLNPHQQRVLTTIMRYPGINQKELTKRTGIDRSMVRRNINTLKNLNLIQNSRNGNNICYEYIPDVEMKYAILRDIVIRFLNNEIDETMFINLKRRLEK
jgi:predicted transcriptional regulator